MGGAEGGDAGGGGGVADTSVGEVVGFEFDGFANDLAGVEFIDIGVDIDGAIFMAAVVSTDAGPVEIFGGGGNDGTTADGVEVGSASDLIVGGAGAGFLFE